MDIRQIWRPRIADLFYYSGYSSNLTPAHFRLDVLSWVLIKFDSRTLQIWCLVLDTHRIRYPRIADLLSYLGYSPNLAPAHCRCDVLSWILAKSGTRALQIWCLILDTRQIWHPRIADMVSSLRYSSNLAPAHCRFDVFNCFSNLLSILLLKLF